MANVDLFGNPNLTPRQLLQQQLAEAMQDTAARTAKADPRARGASMMGAATGGLLTKVLIEKGVLPKPPELVRAEKLAAERDAIQQDATGQGISPETHPTEFADLAASHFLRAGDEQSAMMAINWRNLQEANKRVADKERAQTANLEADTALKNRSKGEGHGRGDFYTYHDTPQGLVAADARQPRLIDPITQQPIQKGKVVKSASDPKLQGELAASKEFGKKTGEAKFDLPRAEANAERVLKTIDDTVGDPALQSVTGPIAGRLPALFGKQARGVARIEQLKGGAFLTAYQELKGGGQITEAEGQKAEAAFARLNRVQDYEDHIAALRDLRAIIDGGLTRARKQAGLSTTDANPVPEAPPLPSGWKVRTK